MEMSINTQFRSTSNEEMDDFGREGKELQNALDKLGDINRYLGGNNAIVAGLEDLMSRIPIDQEISIVDLGCGNGGMLRKVADFGRKKNIKLKLIGVDANPYTLSYAKQCSTTYPKIQYRNIDMMSPDFRDLKADIFLCTLTLHHFKDEEIVELLSVMNRNSRFGIVISDLQRNLWAYRLFKVVCFVFRLNSMSRNDGLISILRGFKRKELLAFSEKLKFNSTLHWKWAFRYQWIIKKKSK